MTSKGMEARSRACVRACVSIGMRACEHVAPDFRRGQAWDWAANHKHVATDPYIPFSFLFLSLLIPLPLFCLPLYFLQFHSSSSRAVTFISSQNSLSIFPFFRLLTQFFQKFLQYSITPDSNGGLHCSATSLWLASQLARFPLQFQALLFTLCHLAELFDVSSHYSHPSIMAVRS